MFQLRINGHIATLSWHSTAELSYLHEKITEICAQTLADHQLTRIQVELPADDITGKKALHLCGFRREGILRNYFKKQDKYLDAWLYSRLSTDEVEGPMGFTTVMNSILPTKRVIGHAVIRNDSGKILLLETSYKKDWELAGGIIEPHETPREGTVREIQEEIGLNVHLGQPALIDWMPPYLGWDDAIEFIFDLGVLDKFEIAKMKLPKTEILNFHWIAPNQISNYVSELSARRISLILNGKTGHSESGYLFN